MSRWFSKGVLIIFCAVVIVVVWRAAAGAAERQSLAGEREENILLRDRLSQNIKTEALLQEEIRDALKLAARPHSEYLFYQKSLGLQSKQAALTQLRQERRDIYNQFALLSGIDATSLDLMREIKDQPVTASSSYSGAPLLAFYNRSSDHSDRLQFSPLWTGVFRVMTGLFLLSLFSLPLIALYKRGSGQQPKDEKGVLFPIFTVQGRDGNRSLLRVSLYGGEMMHLR